VVILGSRDLLEVATGEFGFLSRDNLQVCGHPIVLGCVFSVDLTYYECESHRSSSPATDGGCHLEACNDCFIFGLVVGGLEPESARLLDDGSFWGSEDYPNSSAFAI